MGLLPNRVVAIAVAVLSLVGALVPVVASESWTSTAGILAGIGALVAVALKWLSGSQQSEGFDRQAQLAEQRHRHELERLALAAARPADGHQHPVDKTRPSRARPKAVK